MCCLCEVKKFKNYWSYSFSGYQYCCKSLELHTLNGAPLLKSGPHSCTIPEFCTRIADIRSWFSSLKIFRIWKKENSLDQHGIRKVRFRALFRALIFLNWPSSCWDIAFLKFCVNFGFEMDLFSSKFDTLLMFIGSNFGTV